MKAKKEYSNITEEHIPFSDIKCIDKMVRQIVVFVEQQTLEVTILPGNEGIYKNYPAWIKYVSTKSNIPREIYLYWDTKTEEIFLKDILKRVCEETNYLEKLNIYFHQTYEIFENLSDEFFSQGEDFYNELSNKELIVLFQKFSEANKKCLIGYYLAYDMVALLPKYLEKEIKMQPYLSNPDEIFEVLCTAGIPTLLKTEKQKFFERLIEIQKIYNKCKDWNSPEIQKLIFQQWYEFGSEIYTHESNQVYTAQDYNKKFFKNIDLNAFAEIKKIKDSENETMKKVNESLMLIKNPELFNLIKWLRVFMQYRNLESLNYYSYFDHCSSFFNAIAKRFSITLEDLFFLSQEEIIDGLQNNTSIFEIIENRRKEGFTIKQVGNSIKVFTGVEEEDNHENKHEINHEKFIDLISEIHGSIACRGIAEGKVKIIFDPESQYKLFNEGDVLVTHMTMPDFVPLMQKASAIVTDEGGVLCHAAIIAREFNKPCIIGTKIATQVLKNGDLVEVNADNGTIKRLNI